MTATLGLLFSLVGVPSEGTGAWVDPGATALDPNGGEAVPVIQGSDQPDPGLALAKYAFEGNADDSTLNQLDLQTVGGPTFTTDTPFGLPGMSPSSTRCAPTAVPCAEPGKM